MDEDMDFDAKAVQETPQIHGQAYYDGRKML